MLDERADSERWSSMNKAWRGYNEIKIALVTRAVRGWYSTGSGLTGRLVDMWREDSVCVQIAVPPCFHCVPVDTHTSSASDRIASGFSSPRLLFQKSMLHYDIAFRDLQYLWIYHVNYVNLLPSFFCQEPAKIACQNNGMDSNGFVVLNWTVIQTPWIRRNT